LSYAKGANTRSLIKSVASQLFYRSGFHATTIRQISERAQCNVGLIKYHFGGKTEIALEIYGDIRDGFDALIDRGDIREDTSDFFLLSSAVELAACLEDEHFGRFYNELSTEPLVREQVQQRIFRALLHYAAPGGSGPETTLACTSLAAIKPAIVAYLLQGGGEKIPTKQVLRYYLQQQLHFLAEDESRADELIRILDSYYIAIADNFTPILVQVRKSKEPCEDH